MAFELLRNAGNRTITASLILAREWRVNRGENQYWCYFRIDESDFFESSLNRAYFLEIDDAKSNSIAESIYADDYVCPRRQDVKFVTFNKNKENRVIDGIFDDGVTVPVRPPRRKKCLRRNVAGLPSGAFFRDDDRSSSSYDYVPDTASMDGVSTTSWSKLSLSSESDSFTNCSCDRDFTSSDDGSHLSLTIDRVPSNTHGTLSYRSINTESGYSQFHSFSSEYSLLSSDIENVDDVAGLHRLSKSATMLSDVETWLLDLYFSAFHAEDEELSCEQKV